MSLEDIRKRVERWSFSGYFIPDTEQPTGENYIEVLRDREVLLHLLDATELRFKRAHEQKENLHRRLAKTIDTGAENHGELTTALQLLVATASVLPYRKNKNALAVQGAVESFLEKHGLGELLSQAYKREEDRRLRRKQKATGEAEAEDEQH